MVGSPRSLPLSGAAWSSSISVSSDCVSGTIFGGSATVLTGAIGCNNSLSVGSMSSRYDRSLPSDNSASIAILVSSLVVATVIVLFCSDGMVLGFSLLVLATASDFRC